MTNTIESIDLQIKELQEQKRRLIEEERQLEKEADLIEVSSIVEDANQRLYEILAVDGINTFDVLSIRLNKSESVNVDSMISISLLNFFNQVLFSKVISVANIHLLVDRIFTNAVALAEINRKFGSMLKLDNSYRDSIRLMTPKSVEVRLDLSEEDNKFDISVQEDLDISADKLVIGSKDLRASVEVDGLCLSAKFVYKKDCVEVDEIAEVIEEIDSEVDNVIISEYQKLERYQQWETSINGTETKIKKAIN